MSPRYSTQAGGIADVLPVIGGVVVVAFVILVILAVAMPDQPDVWLAMMGLALYVAFWLNLPIRYEVWEDRLEIVYLYRRWRIGFETIEKIETPTWWRSLVWCLYLTGGWSQVLVCRNKARIIGRPNLLLSPSNKD